MTKNSKITAVYFSTDIFYQGNKTFERLMLNHASRKNWSIQKTTGALVVTTDTGEMLYIPMSSVKNIIFEEPNG